MSNTGMDEFLRWAVAQGADARARQAAVDTGEGAWCDDPECCAAEATRMVAEAVEAAAARRRAGLRVIDGGKARAGAAGSAARPPQERLRTSVRVSTADDPQKAAQERWEPPT